MKILVYGYGNPGRKDDGLAIELINKIENWSGAQKMHHVDFETNYQLNIEDAYKLSNYDLAIFADASCEDIDGIKITRVEAEIDSLSFTMHEVSVSYILKLCIELFSKNPPTYQLHIKGYEWQLEEGLSSSAIDSLVETEKFMRSALSLNNDKIIALLEMNLKSTNSVY